MRFPDFLIIGAMKAGTTTLYRDLLTNPAVYMPAEKEPGNLCHDEVLEEAGRRDYGELFRFATPGQICGEASTNYSKLPDFPRVPERAREICGENLKIIYVIREPVARIISQHYHSFVTGRFEPDINGEVRRSPELLNYSRYAMQIKPWIEAFGEANVKILIFEDFVKRRRETTREVSEFLGITPRVDAIDEQAVFNKSDGKMAPMRLWKLVRKNSIYRRFIQPRLPMTLRDRLRALVAPKAPPRPDPPSEETVEFIREQLEEDMSALRQLLGKSDAIWDDKSKAEQPS